VTNDAAKIAELAVQAQTPHQIAADLLLVPSEDGSTKVIDLRDYNESPRRKVGSRTVRDVRSFLTYLKKHREDNTELWADEPNSKIVAVIDAHEKAGLDAGHEGHRITLDLAQTPEWKTWMKSNGVKMTQAEFAEFIEANAADITVPDPATFLEIAQTLLGSVNADWQSAHRLANGQIDFGYKETVTARAGQQGELQIPADFTIAVRPYLGSHRYSLKAHFRYRINQGNVTLPARPPRGRARVRVQGHGRGPAVRPARREHRPRRRQGQPSRRPAGTPRRDAGALRSPGRRAPLTHPAPPGAPPTRRGPFPPTRKVP
jgi:uncharacterized protein YfdQ (DUF2303 family)